MQDEETMRIWKNENVFKRNENKTDSRYDRNT